MRSAWCRGPALTAARNAVSATVLAATGENLSWYVDGEAVPVDVLAGRPVWRPASEGFYQVVAVDRQGREARARVRIRR